MLAGMSLKRRAAPWIVAASAGLLASETTPALDAAEKVLSVEASLPRDGELRIENLLGSVSLRLAAAPGPVRVEARAVAEARTEAEARQLVDAIGLRPVVEGQRVVLRVEFPVDRFVAFRPPKAGVKGTISRWIAPMLPGEPVSLEYGGRQVQVGSIRQATALAVHLTVTVPPDARVGVQQGVGSILGRSLRGRLQLQLEAGEARIEQAFGSLEIVAERADVHVAAFQGDALELRTTSGTLALSEIRVARARLRTAAGAIRGNDVSADELFVESVGGDVQLTGFEPERADVRTGSGQVDLATRLRRTREALIRSTSGDVTLRVGELTYFDLRAETKSGSVKTLGLVLDQVGQDGGAAHLQRGRGGADLRVWATGGSVTVRPYDASRL
jgi:hypothetical protein